MVLSDITKNIIRDEKSKAVAFKVNNGDELNTDEIELLNVNGWVHDSSRPFVRRGFEILLYKRVIDNSLDGIIDMFGAALSNSEGCVDSASAASVSAASVSAASTSPAPFTDEDLIEMFNRHVNLPSLNGGRRKSIKQKNSKRSKKSKNSRKSTKRRR